MKTSGLASAVVLGAVMLSGCAAAQVQGPQMRVHATSAAFVHEAVAQNQTSQRSKRPTHKGSPLLAACKGGNSRSCSQLGDRLSIKYAYAEAHQWYALACNRVSNAMVPTATRLMQLSQELKGMSSLRSEDVAEEAANQQKLAELKVEAIEIRSRIQGCFDAGDSMKLESELKQSLKFYDTVCEFSTLVEAVGEAVPGLEHATESGCTAGEVTRARLGMKTEFTPALFAGVVQKHTAPAVAKQNASEGDGSMVFNGGEL